MNRTIWALLLTTALGAPALAQTPGASTGSGPAPARPSTPPPPATADDDTPVDISAPGAGAADEIVVTGRFIPNTIRSVPEVISVLSAADIARTGEGDIAGALQRVTGLSVVGGGFVYVRGLGDRYSLALLNGSPLPSPEPLRRVVPLDIFPTSILASTLVQKSYSVNYPGEFGGGVINLTTAAIPTETQLSIGVSVGGNSETTGQLGYTHYGSRGDWTGFDSGRRSIPPLLDAALNSGRLIAPGANFTLRQIQDITAQLTNSSTTVAQRNQDIPVNFSADVSGGSAWNIGEDRLGLIASFGYSNSWRTRDAIQQLSGGFANGVLNPDVDFRTVTTDNRIVLNGLLGLGYEFGENKVRVTNLYIRDTIKQTQLSRGFDRDGLGDQESLRQNTFWFARQLINTQFVGEFRFDDLRVDLRGSYANTKRLAPYERSFSYVFDATARDFVNNLRSNGQSARISFSRLNENLWSGGIDASYKLPTAINASIAAGYAYSDTQRGSSRRDFRFNTDQQLNLAVAQQRPDFLLSDYNVYTYGIGLSETSGQAGAAVFRAGLRVHGAYGQVVLEPVDGFSITAGVRYEDGDQFVEPLNVTGAAGAVLNPTTIKRSYWLPAATITWNFAEDMQLRVNASKTVARPQFRELAPQVYQDTESDRQFFGNPFLVDSQLFNAEARYEYYFARDQRFTLAGFFKRIDNPIEAFAFRTSGQLQTTFANAPKADLYGAEVEAQKYIYLDGLNQPFFADRRAVIIANYTYTKSNIKVGAGDTTIFPTGQVLAATNLFTDGDRLTGQSNHLVNLQLGLENTERLSQQTLLFTYASERVTNRGPAGTPQQPDLVERPGLRLDLVFREGFELFGRGFEGKFEIRNLTGTRYEEFQRAGSSRIDINSFDLGTSFSLGVTAKF